MIIQENTIIHGDSLTVLRQMEPESVDAIITDPPYGINYVSQTGASIKNDKSPFIWFLYDAFRVLKSGEAGHGGLICFTRWDVEQTFIDAMKIAGFNVKSEVIWDKVYHGMGDTKAAFAPSHENIVFAVMRTPWAGQRLRRATRPPCGAAASSHGRLCSTTSTPK